MLITRTSMITDEEHTLDINVTQEQMNKFESGRYLIQDVFPHISPQEREFIKSGITPSEWERMFGQFMEEEDCL